MHLHVSLAEIALRLVLTVLAGAVIGFNREQHGGPAGLRTTVLVCLAASLSMIQMNLLLPVDGKTPSSFGVMDMMRLPLGILSGIGFIGGGAILRRGGQVDGVTTAATLWLATVVGLCLGGGQLWLGAGGTGIAALVLWPAKWIDRHMASGHDGRLTLLAAEGAPRAETLNARLGPVGAQARFAGLDRDAPSGAATARYDIHWRAVPDREVARAVLDALEGEFQVLSLEVVR